MLPGSLPSQASSRAARSLAFVQWRRVWDLVIFGPWQNQHLSSRRFLILLRKTTERQ